MAKVDKCTNCHHDCHCKDGLHADEYGLCTCEFCNCKSKADDKTYENEIKNGD
jgi:hypothetical protein